MVRLVDEFVLRFARRWLLWFGLILLGFVTLPFLAPVFMELGWTLPADAIYFLYSLTCHQLAYRSWFLFGDQAAYNIAELQHLLNVQNPALDVWFWRGVRTGDELGYKVAFCQRDSAIYGGMLLTTLFYSLVERGRRVKPLNWKIYLLAFVVPMGADGVSQLLGFRESTPLIRSITGGLFGIGTALLILPMLGATMEDLYAQTAYQLERVRQRTDC
jgi:uncharacterized membrane protein